jgi:ankyrin repeat protein
MTYKLLDAGTDVQTPYGQYALIYAAENGFLELVKKILFAGADINDEDLLYTASLNGRIDIVKYLLEYGAGKDFPEDIDNALEGAVKGERLNIVKLLLKNGANPMANNERAIRLAVEIGNLNIAHALYKRVYSTENNRD